MPAKDAMTDLPAPGPRPAGRSIAAIVPLHNGARTIAAAIRSILDQAVAADEIVVVDDGSTDEGPAIVERLGAPRLKLIRQANAGQSAARNRGAAHSTSALLAFLDQDDVWYPDHLQALLKPFDTARDSPLVWAGPLGWTYSNLDEIDEQGRLVTPGVLGRWKTSHPKRSLEACLREDMFVLPSASLVAREAFDAVGGFDETLSGYEDDDLFRRIFQAGFANAYIDEPLAQWRIYRSSSSFSDRMRVSRLAYFAKLRREFPDPARISRVLAPRFVRSILAEYDRSAAAGDRQRMRLAAQDLRLVSRYLAGRSRLAVASFSIVAPSMLVARAARAVYRRTGRTPFLSS
jgi:glycosyltransferase involved in cell wall biosynthesis